MKKKIKGKAGEGERGMVGNDSSQSKASASIIKVFGWQEVVIVYEDTTGHHYGFIRDLSDAVIKAGIQYH